MSSIGKLVTSSGITGGLTTRSEPISEIKIQWCLYFLNSKASRPHHLFVAFQEMLTGYLMSFYLLHNKSELCIPWNQGTLHPYPAQPTHTGPAPVAPDGGACADHAPYDRHPQHTCQKSKPGNKTKSFCLFFFGRIYDFLVECAKFYLLSPLVISH